MNRIIIKEGTIIGEYVDLSAIESWNSISYNPTIKIGEKCFIGNFSKISAVCSVNLGAGVTTGQHVLITDHNHGDFTWHDLNIHPFDRDLNAKGTIEIGDNVWIGEKVTIIGNVRIGKGSIIGAGAIVLNDIPDYCIAVGIPARVVKQITN